MASGFQIIGQDGATNLKVDAANNAARVGLYDQNANPMAKVVGSLTAPASQAILPIGGFDSDGYARGARMAPFGTLRTTSDTLMFSDAFEGAVVNPVWLISASTLTVTQTAGILSVNAGAGTGANLYAIITGVKPIQKLIRQPLVWMMRAKLASLNSTRSIAEIGFGNPVTNTALVGTGAFFRLSAAGQMRAVISYANAEVETVITGPDSTLEYYLYTIFVDDDDVHFLIQEPDGVVTSDTVVNLALVATPSLFSSSHVASFARVYVDAVGGGTAQTWAISAHEVNMLDVMSNMTWGEQMASLGRTWAVNPVTYAQAPGLASSAPAGGTPSNTATVYATLGGEYIATMTAASENMLSLFAYQVPAGYTLMVRGIYWSLPFVSTTFNIAATAPFILPFCLANLSSANISTAVGPAGTGNLGKVALPFGQMWTAAIGAVAGTMLTGNQIAWYPSQPFAVFSGSFIHLGWKVLVAGAVTAGAIRGSVLIDGYWM